MLRLLIAFAFVSILPGCTHPVWTQFIDVHTWGMAREHAELCIKDIFLYPEDHDEWPEADQGVDQPKVTAAWLSGELRKCMALP